jgi:hypothetical protein
MGRTSRGDNKSKQKRQQAILLAGGLLNYTKEHAL